MKANILDKIRELDTSLRQYVLVLLITTFLIAPTSLIARPAGWYSTNGVRDFFSKKIQRTSKTKSVYHWEKKEELANESLEENIAKDATESLNVKTPAPLSSQEKQSLAQKIEAKYGSPDKQHPVSAIKDCLLYTSPSPRDATLARMPSSA